MDKKIIKQILLEQKEEIKKILGNKIIEREIEERIKKSLRDSLIKVIIGVRRCGKSVLAHQILKNKNYSYVNFDDERFIGAEAKDLNDFLEVLEEINPDFDYLLLDEIQNIEGWELFVNRLKRQGYNIIITGSNSKLLSKELSTHLTGRHFAIELFPFSFREFLDYKNVKYSEKDFYLTKNRAKIKRLLNEYLENGGFPELFKVEFKKQYLRDLYGKILSRDIFSRYKIKYIKELKEISLYLISNFGAKISYHKLKNIFEINSVHTIKNYLNYLEESYLIFQIYPFSFKIKDQIKRSKKNYGIDTGLINSVASQFSPNVGRLMENIVFLELKRKDKEIYFYNDSLGNEIDFVVKEKIKLKQLIQVCYNLNDPATEKREIKPLLQGSKELKCNNLLVITWDTEQEKKIKGKLIRFIPLWKWLL